MLRFVLVRFELMKRTGRQSSILLMPPTNSVTFQLSFLMEHTLLLQILLPGTDAIGLTTNRLLSPRKSRTLLYLRILLMVKVAKLGKNKWQMADCFLISFKLGK